MDGFEGGAIACLVHPFPLASSGSVFIKTPSTQHVHVQPEEIKFNITNQVFLHFIQTYL